MGLRFGVDIGAGNIRIGLVAGNRVKSARHLQTEGEASDVAVSVAKSVSELATGRPIEWIGVACAGHVDAKLGRVLSSPNLGWRNVPLAKLIRQQMALLGAYPEIHVENDVNAAIWGEYRAGALRGADSACAIFIGTGLGGGAILPGGALLRGASGGAAEFGHMLHTPNGRRCRCGRSGCFEAYASGTAIESAYAERTGSERRASEIWAARADDADAGEVARAAVDALAALVLDLSAAFDPERIVFGGGVTHSCDGLTAEVEAAARARMGEQTQTLPRHVEAALGDAAGVIGAALVEPER